VGKGRKIGKYGSGKEKKVTGILWQAGGSHTPHGKHLFNFWGGNCVWAIWYWKGGGDMGKKNKHTTPTRKKGGKSKKIMGGGLEGVRGLPLSTLDDSLIESHRPVIQGK